jgi:hypothetical protein
MNVPITTGLSWESLDGIRRLTNASTGRLSTVLDSARGARPAASTLTVQIDGGAR